MKQFYIQFEKSNKLVFCLSLLLFWGLNGCSQENVGSSTINSVQKIIDDMAKCHEARPHGVSENASWGKCPRLSMGNDPGNWTAMIPWGQVYVSTEGNLAANTRVQLRNLETYYLSKKDNKWHLWNGSYGVEGSAYVENFADDINVDGNERVEPDGSVSVRTQPGYNYHFWSANGRITIDPDDIKGVFSTCQARLIPHDKTLPDDRDSSTYMVSIGADYWKSLNAEWDQWKTNGDIGIGRFKFVKKEWQAFNMHSLTEKELRENSPSIK